MHEMEWQNKNIRFFNLIHYIVSIPVLLKSCIIWINGEGMPVSGHENKTSLVIFLTSTFEVYVFGSLSLFHTLDCLQFLTAFSL